MPHIHNHLSFGAGAIGQLVADVPSGLTPTPPQELRYRVPPLDLGLAVHVLSQLSFIRVYQLLYRVSKRLSLS
jgi:hypothetical protein